jgi:hypothetical protein
LVEMDRIQIRIRIGRSWKVIRIRQTCSSDLIRIYSPVTNAEKTFMARKFWTLLCTKSTCIQGSLLFKYREGIWSVEKRRKNTENMLPELITAIEIISRGYLLHQKIKLLTSSAEPSLEGISIIKKILHI